MRLWYIAFPLFMLPSVCSAAPAAAAGLGAQTCGQYAARYKDDANSARVDYFSWAQGFMTALNVAHIATKSEGYRDLEFVSFDVQEQNIREYCDAHPLANFTDAAFSLYQSLPLIPMK